MIKKIITAFALYCGVLCSAQAQDTLAVDTIQADSIHKATDLLETTAKELPPAPIYGYISYNTMLTEMIEYKDAMLKLKDLRKKYEDEAAYNETAFKRQFAEYLQGQKDFPQSIMLKRQRDLQEALEKSLAFRDEAERLLKQAETEVLAPIKARLDNAIRMVGGAYNLEYIYNMDTNTMPYVNPALVMDVTKLVEQQLQPVQQ